MAAPDPNKPCSLCVPLDALVEDEFGQVIGCSVELSEDVHPECERMLDEYLGELDAERAAGGPF